MNGRLLPIAFLALAIPAAAQLPPGKWWKDPLLLHRLDLSPAQQLAIDELFARERDRLIDLRAAVEKREGALEDAFNKDPFDEARAQAAADAHEKARSDLVRAEVGLQIAIRKILTRDQFERLKEIVPRRPRPPDAPHGPPPPGMGPPIPEPMPPMPPPPRRGEREIRAPIGSRGGELSLPRA